jgi:spectinomycin phosphotransferase
MPALFDFDPARLAEALQRSFAISAASIESFSCGFVGRHYMVEAHSGECYFITLYDDTRLARIAAGRLGCTAPLVHGLYHSGCFRHLAPPLAALDGALWSDLDGWPLLVYPYVDGRLLADELPLPAQTHTELGELVARLHAATPFARRFTNLLREQFVFPFEPSLRQSLQDLAHLPRQDHRASLDLRDLLLPHQDAVTAHLDQLHALAESLRRSPPPFVICHTDLHPWNVIRSRAGDLVVIDWENVCLAPPEHDLFIFTGEGFETFLQAYFQAGSRRALSARTFKFYFYRRYLEDLADFLVRILYENEDPQTDRADLDEIRAMIAGWPDLDTAELRMERILSKV